MSGRTAVILAIVVAFTITATCIAAATKVASKVELAHVSVDDHDSHVNVVFPVPASLLDAAVTLHALECAPRELQQARAALKAAGRELAAAGDVTLLDVQDRNEHVTIRLHGNQLLLRVVSPEATVRISVPHRVVTSI